MGGAACSRDEGRTVATLAVEEADESDALSSLRDKVPNAGVATGLGLGLDGDLNVCGGPSEVFNFCLNRSDILTAS